MRLKCVVFVEKSLKGPRPPASGGWAIRPQTPALLHAHQNFAWFASYYTSKKIMLFKVLSWFFNSKLSITWIWVQKNYVCKM